MTEIQELLDSTLVALDKLQGSMVIPEAQQTADQARNAMKQALAAVVLLQRAGIGHPDFFVLTMSELGKVELVFEQAAMDLGVVEVGLEYTYMPADL